jgi:Protein of unknown function (DUF1189)
MKEFLKSFNPKFYKDIAGQPFSKSLGFLFAVVLFISIIFSFQFSLGMKKVMLQAKAWVDENLEKVTSEIPEIEIKDGSLISPKDKFTKAWETEKAALIIDPQEDNAYSTLEQYDNVFLLTQHKLMVKSLKADGTTEIKSYNLDKVKIFKMSPIPKGVRMVLENKEFEVTDLTVKKWIKMASLLIFPVSLLFVFLWYSFAKILQVLFWSLAALIFNGVFKAKLLYKDLLTIGVYALAGPTVLAVIKSIFNIPIPAFSLIYVLIYLLYLGLGIKEAKVTGDSR